MEYDMWEGTVAWLYCFDRERQSWYVMAMKLTCVARHEKREGGFIWRLCGQRRQRAIPGKASRGWLHFALVL